MFINVMVEEETVRIVDRCVLKTRKGVNGCGLMMSVPSVWGSRKWRSASVDVSITQTKEDKCVSSRQKLVLFLILLSTDLDIFLFA